MQRDNEIKAENSSDRGTLFSKMRDNPWILSTLVLGILFIVVLFVKGSGNFTSGNVISEQEASQKVLSFLESKVSEPVSVQSISQEKGLYKLMVLYQGDSIPVYLTTDGSSLVSDLVPLSGAVDNGAGTGTGTGTGQVVVDLSKIPNAPSLGSVNAPVTIVEFSDYQCPFCEKFYTETFGQLKTNYIDAGKVRFVFASLPLSFHENAEPAARAALCFRKVKGGSDTAYFDFHDKLFENQQSLSDANYKKWAKELGANEAQFNTCFDSKEFADQVQAEMLYGQSLGVSGTPGFFVNGRELVGAQPFASFKQIIDAELAK